VDGSNENLKTIVYKMVNHFIVSVRKWKEQ